MYSYQRRLTYRILFTALLLYFCFAVNSLGEDTLPADEKLGDILANVTPGLQKELAVKKLDLGAPIFIRIFKLQKELEVWLEKDGQYRLFKAYPICSYSGYLGPKIKEGDWQSPEGFYSVSHEQMNPLSSYHLSFNIGYPNDYDTYFKHDGNSIMVHGECSSMGCFAMTNHRMEEIYTLAHYAFENGQQAFDVHVFPFPLTDKNLEKFRSSPWIGFWKNLQPGYLAFEKSRRVPSISVENGKYIIGRPVKLAMSPEKR